MQVGSAGWFFAAVLLAGLIGRPAGAMGSGDARSLAADNGAFALDLYARLGGREGNLLFSPWSISTCLAMVYAGAHGDTAAEMAQTLHFSAEPAPLAAAFGELQRQLNAPDRENGVELNLADGLWGQQGHPFLAAFLALARDTYQASLTQVDFRTQSEPAREAINAWVSQKTKGKITDLLGPGTLNSATRLVLVNAIYFKGRWARPFDKADTANAPFRVAPSQKLEAPLMSLTADFAVIHKAFVEVNEEGTEAAAATGAVARAMAVRRPQPIPTFRADHPFSFLIRDTRSGAILFLGRLVNPVP